ncbi:MAG TPA: hypothetical protein VFO41_07890 [Alphaproteobacteria bacterium]|nr:hypothetical protein [Alphaproteobacteria bacterium]
MSVRRSAARPRPSVVPLDRTGADRFVPWMVAPMVYLATLALIAALAAGTLADRWDADLSGTMTVEIPATASPADQAVRVGAALAVLRDWPGIDAAAPVGDDDVARLLEPWLGQDLPLGDLPLPALIDVRLADQGQVDAAGLRAALAEAAPGTQLDDHGRWREDVRTMAATVRLVALVFVVLIALAAVSAIVFVTRAGLAIHRPVIDLLHLIGATDAYVARQFQRHAFRLAARGALVGLAMTLVTLAGLASALSGIDRMLLPALAMGRGAWLSLGLVPLATAGLATATARLTVLRALARLP